LPRAIISETDVHTARSVVAGDEPPKVGVVIPAWLHEDIVDALHHAVAIHPSIVSIAVRPVPIDPYSVGTDGSGLLHGDGRWRRWRRLRGGGGLGLLHDDHGLAIDLFGLTAPCFDDRIIVRIAGLALLALPHVAIVGDVEVLTAARAVTVRPAIVGRRGIGERCRRTECK